MEVCPTTATKKRADGIVTIDYDLCIGCAYCAVACPYQARYKTDRATFAYGKPTEQESARHDDARLAVATKCTFCVDRIDDGLAKGLQPGVDPEATPACVQPFADRIKKVRWTIFEHSSHMPHVEEKEDCLKAVGDFLDETD